MFIRVEFWRAGVVQPEDVTDRITAIGWRKQPDGEWMLEAETPDALLAHRIAGGDYPAVELHGLRADTAIGLTLKRAVYVPEKRTPAPPNEYAPDYVSPPSETLRELMADRGWSRPALADRMNVTPGVVDALMHDQYEYVPWLCAALETATGVSAALWRRRWEHWQARKAEGVTPENE